MKTSFPHNIRDPDIERLQGNATQQRGPGQRLQSLACGREVPPADLWSGLVCPPPVPLCEGASPPPPWLNACTAGQAPHVPQASRGGLLAQRPCTYRRGSVGKKVREGG